MSQKDRYYEHTLKCEHCRETFTPTLLRPTPILRRGKATLHPTQEQLDEYEASRQEAAELKDRHVRREHADLYIATRMAQIEQQAKWQDDGKQNWQTDPLAIEYRALLKEWWTLTPSDAAQRQSPSRNRLLTAKGDMHKGGGLINSDTWFTRDRRNLIAKAEKSGQLVGVWFTLEVEQTSYKFFPTVFVKTLAQSA